MNSTQSQRYIDMETEENDQFAIVAIGASAGNQEALQEFLAEVPRTINACFVVILHLSRDHRTKMPEIISKFTKMNVIRVSDVCTLKPGNIYVMPEGVTMAIKDRILYLYPRKNGAIKNTAIDDFLWTFARTEHDRCLAVILSGMGADGTDGAIAIHEEGGKILVQDPRSTEFDGMPNSVIAFDHPNLIAPPRHLGKALARIVKQEYRQNTSESR